MFDFPAIPGATHIGKTKSRMRRAVIPIVAGPALDS